MTDMPQPRQLTRSAWAFWRTFSGKVAGPAAKLKTRSEEVEDEAVWRGVVVVELAAEQVIDTDLYVEVRVVVGWKWVVEKVARWVVDLRDGWFWWVVGLLRRKDWEVAADIAMGIRMLFAFFFSLGLWCLRGLGDAEEKGESWCYLY